MISESLRIGKMYCVVEVWPVRSIVTCVLSRRSDDSMTNRGKIDLKTETAMSS